MVKSDSVHRRSHHLGHTATAHCERARGKPKQQVQFIFNSKFTVMHALLKSVFGLTLIWDFVIVVVVVCPHS